MQINHRKMLIFPEYHLTDFPPQITLSQNQAYDILAGYKKFGFDLFIAGYVEKENGNNYSSCLIIDDNQVFNIRKQTPFKDEIGLISPSDRVNDPIPLTIGLSYFLICHDIQVLLADPPDDLKTKNIDNLVLISAMFFNFKETMAEGVAFCRRNNIRRFITSDLFYGVQQKTIGL